MTSKYKINWRSMGQSYYVSDCGRFRIQSIKGIGLAVDRWELISGHDVVLSEVRIGEAKRKANEIAEGQSSEDSPMTAEDLFANGWTVIRGLLYDEECVEGWQWTSPEGWEYAEIGDWNEPPPLPDLNRWMRDKGLSKP